MKTQVDRLVRLECIRELRVLGRKCPGEREEAAWVLALYVVCTPGLRKRGQGEGEAQGWEEGRVGD